LVTKIRRVPACSLEGKSCGSDLLDKPWLVTLRAVKERRVGEFLKGVFLKPAPLTTIGVDRHGFPSCIKDARRKSGAIGQEILPVNAP
jgi:hypothetical protein